MEMGSIGFELILPSFFVVLLGYIGFYWVLLGYMKDYSYLWKLPSFLPGFTGLVWVLVRMEMGSIGFKLILPSFTGFYWAVLGFTGFYLVI